MKLNYGVIYKTTNIINGHFYIGQTIRKGANFKFYIGGGIALKDAIEKYGKENFKKEILCECGTQKSLDIMERFFIFHLKPNYNIARGGWGRGKHSEETKKKISNSKQNTSEDARRKMSISHKGMKYSVETLAKKSVSMKGKNTFKRTEETKKKMSDSAKERYKKNKHPMSGVVLSEEAKQRLRTLRIGTTSSEETRKKISEKNKGRKMSEEAKKNISISKKGERHPNFGKHLSKETIKKMNDGRKKHYTEENKQKRSDATKKGWETRRKNCGLSPAV